MLNQQDLLAADDLPVRKVPLDRWIPGGAVCVRTLSAHDVEMRLPELTGDDEQPRPDIAAHIAAFFLCDGSGNRMFPDEDRDAFEANVARLAGRNPAMLQAIIEAGNAHNGIGSDEQDVMVKNSAAGQG